MTIGVLTLKRRGGLSHKTANRGEGRAGSGQRVDNAYARRARCVN